MQKRAPFPPQYVSIISPASENIDAEEILNALLCRSHDNTSQDLKSLYQLFQKRLASLQHITICCCKISRIPRIGNVSFRPRK